MLTAKSIKNILAMFTTYAQVSAGLMLLIFSIVFLQSKSAYAASAFLLPVFVCGF